MANILEKDNSILEGNLNLRRSYLITTVCHQLFVSTSWLIRSKLTYTKSHSLSGFRHVELFFKFQVKN